MLLVLHKVAYTLKHALSTTLRHGKEAAATRGAMARTFEIAVFQGDGIGPEVIAPTLSLLDELAEGSRAYSLRFIDLPAGAGHYATTGEALPAASIAAARDADAILLAAMGLPTVRYPDGTEITPQIDLRMEFGLYAGLRPVQIRPGQPTPLRLDGGQPVDFALVRESTEGLFFTLGKGEVGADEARETLRITRRTSEKLFRFAFELARKRREEGKGRGHVTCVDKANVFRAFAFFRGIFDEIAREYPDVTHDHAYVDAISLWMVERPWSFDVLVTENMFGDILSDLGAGLMGGLGLAPSADIGDANALFQPCHGTAPDIVGRGLANPIAMVLSAGMMLDWLGTRHGISELREDAARIDGAVGSVLGEGNVRTRDMGGTHGTEDMITAIRTAMQRVSA